MCLVILGLFYDVEMKSLEPRKETSLVRNDKFHELVKGLTTIIGLVSVAKDTEPCRPDDVGPKFLHVLLVED